MQLVRNRNTLKLLSLIHPFQIMTGQIQKTQITLYDYNVLNSENKLYVCLMYSDNTFKWLLFWVALFSLIPKQIIIKLINN